MTHDQIGPDFRASFHRLVDGVGMPDTVLEGTAAVVGLPGGTSLNAILNPPHAAFVARRPLRHESTLEAVLPDQMTGNLAELGWEVLMDEEDMHGVVVSG